MAPGMGQTSQPLFAGLYLGEKGDTNVVEFRHINRSTLWCDVIDEDELGKFVRPLLNYAIP